MREISDAVLRAIFTCHIPLNESEKSGIAKLRFANK